MPNFNMALPQIAAPEPMKAMAGLLGVANASQQVQSGNIANQSNQAVLNERNALRSLAQDPGVLDEHGNVDPGKFSLRAPQVAPTLGAPVSKAITEASTAQTANAAAGFKLSADQGEKLYGLLGGLANDPSVKSGDPQGMVASLADARDRAISIGLPKHLVETRIAALIAQAQSDPKGVQQRLVNIIQGGTPAGTQSSQIQPNVTTVQTNQGTQFVQANPQAPGGPGNIGTPYTPPNGIATSPTGQMGIVSPATGGFTPVQNTAPTQPPVNFPNGESKETWNELQGQRTAAQQAANGAPVMHDINKTIVSEANKGFSTGTLGALTQKVASATGYQLGANESATDYNVLGKMLERSALTAAQSMGPHTNAGLEAAVRANGSLDYTPAALKKIAYLNDALTSGSELYSQGLEKAITSNPDNVFAKRKFDEAWRSVATPEVLRFKNAVDNGNEEEKNAILKQVGGKASTGAKHLFLQLQGVLNLAGQQ